MNKRISGKAPEKIKRLAAMLLSALLLSGCGGNSPPVSTGDHSESSGYISSESSSDESTGSSESSSSTTSSSLSSSSSDETSTEYSSSSDESSSETSISSSSDSESSSSEQSSSEQSSSSSSTALGSTASSSTPAPPPVVVIPTIKTPTSPGTKTAEGKNGVIDYSNADSGYISAKYTGDSAKCKLRVTCGEKTYDFDISNTGATEYFPLSCGKGSYTANLYEQVPGKTTYVPAATAEFTAAPDGVTAYMFPNKYVYYTQSSNCVKKSAEACAGKTDTIEKISAVFNCVTELLEYDYALASSVTKSYIPNPDATLAKRKGICFDYASLMAAMLRSQSIPTRLVVGYASPDIFHAWNEVWTEETGWITPQLFLKSHGYNLVDSTFYDSNTDKDKISSYISNGANYSVLFYY